MELFLQAWGGGFYLLNKILFAFAEGKKRETKRLLKIAGWCVYLLGVPAWVMILISEHDWIAASVEAGGVPSMFLGLVTVYRHSGSAQKSLDFTAATFTYGFLIFGTGYSIYDYGGITSASQVLEIGAMLGFLLGSYLLAKNNLRGWLFFMLMNASMAALMFIQHKHILSIQQLISLCFVIYGFTVALRSRKRLD
jgi:hypothetical protein